jgi:hypothetical protein
MKSIKYSVTIGLAIIFSATTVGCGKSQSQNGTSSAASTGSAPVDVSAQMQKAADATTQAQQAIDDANTALATIMDSNGNIILSLFQSSGPSTSTSSSSSAGGLLAPLVNKLSAVFDQVFAKIDTVKSEIAAARAALTDAMGKLNSSDPVQAAEIQTIQDEMAKIDSLESTFQTAIHGLAGKLDLAETALNKLVSTATSFIPFPGAGVIAGFLIDTFLLDDVTNLIDSVKARLLAV